MPLRFPMTHGRDLVTRVSAGLCLAACVWSSGSTRGADPEAALPLAPHGTAFHFEVIESHDGKYLGDTPGHVGKDGGLTVRPRVSLGDAVFRTEGKAHAVVGRVTHVVWNRVSGSLEVEFDPEPFQRIAVGEEVWIDLNPRPTPAPAPAVGP